MIFVSIARPFVPLTALIVVLAPPVAAQQGMPPAAVIVAPVEESVLSVTDSFIGRVEAVSHVDIQARIDGFVREIKFDEGQNVSSGDVLFKIEDDAYSAAVQEIQGQISAAQAEKKLAEIELNRQQELLQRNVAAQTSVQEAEAQVGQIDGQIVQLQGSLQAAQLDLSYTEITAPFDGRVGLTDVSLGAYVSSGSGDTLVSVSSIDPIYVTFPVPEATLLDVRKRYLQPSGDVTPPDAQITLSNGEVYDQSGAIEVVDTIVQEGTDSVLVRASFPNPDGVLRDGQLVRIDLIEKDAETALTFPVQGLQREQGGYFVYTVGSDNTVAKAEIEVERIAGAKVVVTSGLEKGDQVITEGVQKTRPGATVQISTATNGVPAQ